MSEKNTEYFNPFLANVPILYPLKTPQNQGFSGVFRGYKMGTLARNGSKIIGSWFRVFQLDKKMCW